MYGKSERLRDIIEKKEDGKSNTDKILKLLKNKGYTFNNKPFDTWKVRQIISNPFYMGVLKYGETKSVGVHQPIVSKRLYNLVSG